MSQKNLVLFRQDATGVVYKDPSDPDYSVRIKATSSQKTVNEIKATNDRVEFIALDSAKVNSDLQDGSVLDARSVRVSLSGNPASYADLLDMLDALHSNIRVWVTEQHVAKGFPPTTPPTRLSGE